MTCPVKSMHTHSAVMPETVTVPNVMKAIQIHKFGGPDVLKVERDVLVPKCGVNQVLIQVFTAGVNPCETYARSGNFGITELPFTPGSDCAGVVVKIGCEVTKVKVGDRVYTVQTVSGSYAEFALAMEAHTFRLHEDLTFSQGAVLGVPYFAAYRALFFGAECQRGETVLVHGASGAVGTACCQIASAYGMQVFATAGSERGIKMLQRNNISCVFNHNKKNYMKALQEAVGDKGIDIICEMLACKNLKNDIQFLARHGRVMVIGSRGQTTFSPSDLLSGEMKIQGVAVFKSSDSEYSQMAAALDAGVTAGWLRPVIAHEFPLEAAADAHIEVMEHKEGSAGKLILSIS